jgi:hypothetical protein
VPQEWPAILGHHGDVEDEMVKRLRVLCHVGLSSLLTGGGSRPGRGRVDKVESPGSWGTVLVVSSLEDDQWQNSARYGAYSDKFSPPIPGWAVKKRDLTPVLLPRRLLL